MVAVMDAGAKRAQTSSMAYGAPTDAIGLTAYSYVIQGDDGEGGRNFTRTAGGVLMLGVAGGVWMLRRRFLV
jgi:putative membrane protein